MRQLSDRKRAHLDVDANYGARSDIGWLFAELQAFGLAGTPVHVALSVMVQLGHEWIPASHCHLESELLWGTGDRLMDKKFRAACCKPWKWTEEGAKISEDDLGQYGQSTR